MGVLEDLFNLLYFGLGMVVIISLMGYFLLIFLMGMGI